MDKRIKTKVITTIIYMLLSILALYTFIFVAEVSKGWGITLVVIAIFWIIFRVSNLVNGNNKILFYEIGIESNKYWKLLM